MAKYSEKDYEAIRDAYLRIKNLKLVEKETGVPWQTVYWVVKTKYGIECTGDKERYGNKSDQFARTVELYFLKLVPHAKDMNHVKFQSSYDFEVNNIRIDVKSANRGSQNRYAFSMKQKETLADFVVCFGYDSLQFEKERSRNLL